jgi:flagellar basal body-associated protein FliL
MVDLMLYESSSKDQKRILWVAIALMIAVSVIVLALTLWMLYRANFEQRVADLQAMSWHRSALSMPWHALTGNSVITAAPRLQHWGRLSTDFPGSAGLAKPVN